MIALYLYFVPLFQSQKLAGPFFALLILTYIEGPSILFLLIFAAFFYYLLLIKDLLLIDRKSAYELVIFALAFFFIRSFYEHLGTNIITAASLGYGLLLAGLIGFLVNGFVRSFSGKDDMSGVNTRAHLLSHRTVAWIVFLLVWQFLVLGLFLPLDFVYQSVIIFLIAVAIIDVVPEYYFGDISRQKLLTAGTAIFALLVIVFVSAPWGL